MGMRKLASEQGNQLSPAGLPSNLRLAVLDRDARFVEQLVACARPLGWTLMTHRAAVTSQTLRDYSTDAVLVDVNLLGPRWDDWIARHPVQIPSLGVVVCTRRSTLNQRVRGFRVGADDWVTKPCDPVEVLARVHAVVRRCRRGLDATRSLDSAGTLSIRTDLFDVFAGDRPARLTRSEFAAVVYLARNEGLVLGREEIHHAVWGDAMASSGRAIDTLVRKIRAKLRAVSPGWRYVHTHRGLGYRFGAERARKGGAAQSGRLPKPK
jgi:DNA-binding response OmpR family regulator